MALFNLGIIGERAAGRAALAEAGRAEETAAMLALIARLADQISARDLMADDDGAVQGALRELGVSYGFTRLAQAARDTRLDERAV